MYRSLRAHRAADTSRQPAVSQNVVHADQVFMPVVLHLSSATVRQAPAVRQVEVALRWTAERHRRSGPGSGVRDGEDAERLRGVDRAHRQLHRQLRAKFLQQEEIRVPRASRGSRGPDEHEERQPAVEHVRGERAEAAHRREDMHQLPRNHTEDLNGAKQTHDHQTERHRQLFEENSVHLGGAQVGDGDDHAGSIEGAPAGIVEEREGFPQAHHALLGTDGHRAPHRRVLPRGDIVLKFLIISEKFWILEIFIPRDTEKFWRILIHSFLKTSEELFTFFQNF